MGENFFFHDKKIINTCQFTFSYLLAAFEVLVATALFAFQVHLPKAPDVCYQSLHYELKIYEVFHPFFSFQVTLQKMEFLNVISKRYEEKNECIL